MPWILVVEDDEDLQFLYASALKRQNYEIVGVTTVSDAILYLTTHDFDLIILDMNMPDTSGMRLVEFVHDDVRLKHIPIIVASATDMYRGQVLALGVSHYLIKPLTLQELIRLVKSTLEA
jgi:DNA-binding response OmpR family regulator